MSNKIFCKDCRHFREGEAIPFSYGPPETMRELCMAPENFKDTHKVANELPITQPTIINRFNDCIWFDAIVVETGSSSSSSSGECIIDMP